jgi:uncharacterized protein YlxW (UPF0749 family)
MCLQNSESAMTEKFSEKPKPTASEYLSASLEDIVERANKSTSESEIPFVTALLSAKASRDQKTASNRMFWVAVVTTVIAVVSLATTISSRTNSDALETYVRDLVEHLSQQESELNFMSSKISDLEDEFAAARRELLILTTRGEELSGENSSEAPQSEEHNNPLNSQATPAGTPQSGAH